MKKIFKCLITVLMIAAISICAVACGGGNGGNVDNNDNRFWADNEFTGDANRRPDRAPVQKTLTLTGGATFADGSTEKVWDSATKLVLGKDILLTVPEGKRVSGWNVTYPDTEQGVIGGYNSGADFETLRSDATIKPVFDVSEETYVSSVKFGKVSNFAWERRDAQTSETGFIKKDTQIKTQVGGELGSLFHVVGGNKEEADASARIPAGWHTLFLSGYKVVSSVFYGVTYTIENFGDEAVDIKLHQTNSSSNPMTTKEVSAPTHIEAGEVKTAFLTFGGWDNGNILTCLELLSPVKELNIGIHAYIDNYANASERTLSVEDGAIEGQTEKSVKVKEGQFIPKLTYELTDNTKLWLGWVNAKNEKEKYPKDAFVMPQYDLTLKPWVEDKQPRTVTLGEGLRFAGGATTKTLLPEQSLAFSDIEFSDGREIPAGHRIMYMVSSQSAFGYYLENETYTMPNEDVTVTFARFEVVYSSTNGRLIIYGKPNSGIATSVRDTIGKLIPKSYAWGAIGESEDAQSGTIYELVRKDGTDVAKNDFVMFQSNDNPRKGKYTDKATVMNMGDTVIKISIHISRQSTAYTKNGSSATVEIQPGGVVVFEYDVDFDVDNNAEMISIRYDGDESLESFKIGLYIDRAPKAA